MNPFYRLAQKFRHRKDFDLGVLLIIIQRYTVSNEQFLQGLALIHPLYRRTG